MTNKKKCCLCGDAIVGWGHNPEPFKSEVGGYYRCCGACKDTKVVPARIAIVMGGN